jgi:hypothetical protein
MNWTKTLVPALRKTLAHSEIPSHKLLPLLLLLVLPAVVQAQFTFTTNNSAITITGYTGSNGVVTVPGTIEGLPVTGIGDWAFYATSVTNVLIPDSVTNIGDGAFFDCESLTNVTIGSSVTNIGNWTFAFCSSLTSVCFRGNAPGLGGADVFYGNLATVYYLSGATNWGPTFDGHPAVLWNPPVPFTYTTNSDGITLTITGYTDSGEAVTIPDSINFLPVTTIGTYAFLNYSGLTSVTIPNSVINIGFEAFTGCSGLTSVTIGSNVTSIGDGAFGWCSGLTNVTIPNSVTNIGDNAFVFCSNLASTTIGCPNLGNWFCGLPSLTSVTLLNSVTNIVSGAFGGCSGLTSVIIPASVIGIGDGAFGNCSDLTNITVAPNNPVYSSAGGVLFDVDQVTLIQFPEGLGSSYSIPAGVTSIGDSAFANCSGLTSVIIPNSVIGIPDGAFYECGSLTNVTIGTNVTRIGDDAFGWCSDLTSVTMPSSVTSIGSNAFEWCSGLMSVTMPNSVTNIGSFAFYACSGLTNAIIPNNVISIGYEAFAGCSGLSQRQYSQQCHQHGHRSVCMVLWPDQRHHWLPQYCQWVILRSAADQRHPS